MSTPNFRKSRAGARALARWALCLVAAAVFLQGCGEGAIVNQPVTSGPSQGSSSGTGGSGGGGSSLAGPAIVGRVGDGRQVAFAPIQAQVDVLSATGTLIGSATTDANGNYTVSMPALGAPGLVTVRATPTAAAQAGYQPIQRKINFLGSASVDLYPSSTVLRGALLDTNANPVSADLWVFREATAGKGDFMPYPLGDGRDFLPPAPSMNSKFGWDTGPDGSFQIPVQMPNANFRLTIVVDRKNEMLTNTSTDFFVTPNVINDVATPALAVKAFTPASFANDVQPILTASCAISGCHSGSSPTGRLNLSAGVAYANLVNVPSGGAPTVKRVQPGNAWQSYLYHKVSGTADLSDNQTVAGAQMPLVGNKLSSAQMSAILNWIEEGARNN